MVVRDPPAPPQVSEPARGDLCDALIEEAKQRARRRRLTYGGFAFVAIAAIVIGYSIFASAPPPRGATGDGPTPPAALRGEPPDGARSTLLASWGQIHVGYVLVYEDGRVIWYPDQGVGVDATGRVWNPGEGIFGPVEIHHVHLERRLSPLGLDLVRSGQLEPNDFLQSSAPHQRDELWADPEPHVYVPSRFAACYDGHPRRGDATWAIGRLPQPVRPLLDGREHTYRPSDPAGLSAGGEPIAPVGCWELSADGAQTLARTLADSGAKEPLGTAGEDRDIAEDRHLAPADLSDPDDLPMLVYAQGDGSWIGIGFVPVMPHGEWVLFGG
jgi:hypothetical protein